MAPAPLGELTALPQTSELDLRQPISKEREKRESRGRGMGRKGRGGKGREEGKKRKGEGKGCSPPNLQTKLRS